MRLFARRMLPDAMLHTKLMLALAVLVVLVVAACAYVVIERERERADFRVNERATQLAELLSTSLALPLWNVDRKAIDRQLAILSRSPEVAELSLIDVKYGPVFTVAGPLAEAPGERVVRVRPIEYTTSEGLPAQKIGEIRVALSHAIIDETIARFRNAILAIAAVVIGTLYAGSYVLLRRMLRGPVNRLETTVDRIADGDLDARCAVESGDELGHLAARVNAMAARMRESTARLRRLIDANIIGIFIWDFDGRILEANDAFLDILGYDRTDLVAGHLRWTDLTPAEWLGRDAPRIEESKTTGTIQPSEKEYLRKDGSRVPVLRGSALFEEGGNQGVAFVLDLTERKRAAEALREAQTALAHVNRVTTLGVLAASIAHEVNQPLGAMVASAGSCSRWLAAEPPDFEKAQRALERIARDGRRASEVIDRIRTLVQRQPPRRDAVDVNEAILEVIALTRDEMRRHEISLDTSLARDLPPMAGDRVQLQQVILNLVVNAIEAMSAVGGRRREFAIRSTQDGQSLLVEVRDSGPGIDPERADQLFEAFYTTKADGIGMGLAISRMIIEAHGGRLWAGPNEPHGAAFRFSLPVKEAPAHGS